MKDSYPYLIRYLNPRCRICGSPLTSWRSINHKSGPVGQRCFAEEQGRPMRQWKKSVIDEVPFTVTGNKEYVQMRIDDF